MIYPILMYHQVDRSPKRGTPLRGLTVTPESFGRQMGLLHLLGYQGLSMKDLEPYLRGEIVGKVFGITFDDGYQNNISYALPILLNYGFTATCYAVSDTNQRYNLWDRQKGVPQKALLTKSEMREWVRQGMDLGAHTKNHIDLTKLNFPQSVEQILGSKQELQEITGQEVRHFCYPYGRYSPQHIQILQDSGYISATTVKRGRFHEGDSLFELPRVMIAHSNPLFLFAAKTLWRYEDKYR